MENVTVIIAGVGGQGTVLAARLLAGAALRTGLEVRGSETIGMAQRGGSVTSHVRMGHGIASPLLSKGQADVIIAFEPGEAARALDYLSPDGILVLSDRAIIPSTAVDSTYNPEATIADLRTKFAADDSQHSHLHILNGEEIIANCGAKSLNVALLAYAIALDVFNFSLLEFEEEVRARSGKHAEANANAIKYGTSYRSLRLDRAEDRQSK
jgi:indolepyruvate ferredoxin oxidoreductase beta subunit